MKLIIAIVMLVSAVAHCQSPADEIAAAERSFAAMSRTNGVRSAFVQWLAPGCVMFAPGPVDGRELYRSRPEKPFFLDWRPAFVLASASGEFGISTGPWELSASKNDTPSAFGHFFSVWKRTAEGWRVVFDNGISYPQTQRRPEELRVTTLRSITKKGSQTEVQTMTGAEERFTSRWRSGGKEVAYRQFKADEIRFYRPGQYPTAEKEMASSARAMTPDFRTITVAGNGISAADDLGFVYGIAVSTAGDSSSFMRVWQRMNDGEWKIAVDMLDPFPR